DDGMQTLAWSLSGLDPECAAACSAANCCGVHIHVGMDCTDAGTIGGHYWDSGMYSTDPWLTVMYNGSMSSDLETGLVVATGLSASDVLNRAMVIHDFTGARIACGIIAPASVPSFSTYPGYTGGLSTAGMMGVTSSGTMQSLTWLLTQGLDTRCG
ncbi:unnamed protein product, partial [Effrenium voratum]